MTGYTVHTGSTKKFTQGWDQIFSKGKVPDSSEEGAPKAGKSGAKKKAPRSTESKAAGAPKRAAKGKRRGK